MDGATRSQATNAGMESFEDEETGQEELGASLEQRARTICVEVPFIAPDLRLF